MAKKQVIRLTEGDLHRIIKESVNNILNEIGDTHRGQYMLGRLKYRQSSQGGKFARNTNYIDAGETAYKANGGRYSNDYQQGYEDEMKYGRNADSTWNFNNYNTIKFNYDAKQMQDMDELGDKFINFIENYKGGMLMQTIVDYESGNETGSPQSPLDEIIPYFEEEVLGYECTPEIKKAIKRAYNQWWFYAQDQFMSN